MIPSLFLMFMMLCASFFMPLACIQPLRQFMRLLHFPALRNLHFQSWLHQYLQRLLLLFQIVPFAPKSALLSRTLRTTSSPVARPIRHPLHSRYIKPRPIIRNPVHHISSVPSSKASPYIPSSHISSAADSDRIAHLEKELEMLRSQQAIFAHLAPPERLDIPGYTPPHAPNFGSAPPHRPKLAVPPVIQLQPLQSPPGLPALPLRPPVVPKHSPDLPLVIRQLPLSPNMPHLASDTSRSPSALLLLHPEPLHISEPPSSGK